MQSGGNIERLCHQRFVNIVDHLGSVTCKVNDLLDAKVDEVSDVEHRVSCLDRYACILEWILKIVIQ